VDKQVARCAGGQECRRPSFRLSSGQESILNQVDLLGACVRVDRDQGFVVLVGLM